MIVKKIIVHNLSGDLSRPPTQTYTPEEFVAKLNDGSFEEIFDKEKEKYKHEEDTRSKHTQMDGLHFIGWDACTRCPLRANLQREEGET